MMGQQFTANEGEARAGELIRQANRGISEASKEQVMLGEVKTIVASADQIFRRVHVRDEGVDAEVGFNNDKGPGTGVKLDLQLKSGDSHLRSRKGRREVFAMKRHYERYWAADGAYRCTRSFAAATAASAT